MNTLALDISSTNIGAVALVDGSVAWAGTLVLKGDLWHRIRQARHELLAHLVPQLAAYAIDAVAYEGPAHRAQILSVVAQQRMVGVALLTLLERQPDLWIVEVSPATAKKALTGSGRADKAAMILSAASQITWRQPTEHEADALAVGLAAQPMLAMPVLKPAARTRKKAA